MNKIGVLTHRVRDKMVANFVNDIFKCISIKMFKFRLTFTEVCSQGSNGQYSSIGSDNGLAPNRRQAIIWTSDGLGCRRIYVSFGLNESSHPWLGFMLSVLFKSVAVVVAVIIRPERQFWTKWSSQYYRGRHSAICTETKTEENILSQL